MNGHCPGVEDAQCLKMEYRSGAVAGHDNVFFFRRFRQMDQKKGVMTAGDLLDGQQRLGRTGIGGVAEEGRNDCRPCFSPFGQELLRRRCMCGDFGLLDPVDVGIQDSHPGDAADAGLLGGPGNGTGVEIAVAEGGRPGKDHLRNPQQRPGTDHFPADEPSFRRKDMVVEPVHKGEIVRQTAKTDHWDVGVSVYEAGKDETSRGVDDLPGGIESGQGIVGGGNEKDFAITNS